MGIFNLTDITFSKDASKKSGPLASLVGGSSAFAYNVFRYPIDIGNYDKGHYMVFHINEQIKTNFPGTATGLDTATGLSQNNYAKSAVGAVSVAGKVSGLIQYGTEIVNSVLNKVKNTPDTGSAVYNANMQIANQSDQAYLGGAAAGLNELAADVKNNLSFARTTRQTTSTVALYMPDTLAFTQNQHYDTLSVGGTAGAAILSGVSSIADTLKKGGKPEDMGKALVKNLSPMLASYFLKTVGGNLGTVIGAAGLGAVQNPMLEVIYSSPELRSFRFDFMLYPRSEEEAQEVQKLIDRFKYHQAPEYLQNSGGFFLVPPSEFDIKFYYNGQENPNIPKIQTCVLESIDVDYAPNGFSAYEIPQETYPSSGRTGMPVGIRLSLAFRETEIITKQLLKDQQSSIS